MKVAMEVSARVTSACIRPAKRLECPWRRTGLTRSISASLGMRSIGNSPRFQQSTAIGLDFAGQEFPDLRQPVLFLAAEQLLEGEEVAVGVGKVVDVDGIFGHGVPHK